MSELPIASLKRPKPGEGEEELLQMQEEFEKSKSTPCAKVVNLRIDKSQEKKPVKIVSKFMQRKKLEAQRKGIFTSQTSDEVTNLSFEAGDKVTDPVNDLPIRSTNIVLGNIVERKYNKEQLKAFENKQNEKLFFNCSNNGFPPILDLADLVHL